VLREHQERADNPSRTYLNDCEESPECLSQTIYRTDGNTRRQQIR
jgi:hypothetical protein